MMLTKHYLGPSTILMLVLLVEAQTAKQDAFLEHTCRLLGEKFVISNPWNVYPIIYEPISRGRLTIWTGVSTLPTSEFKCYGIGQQANNQRVDNSTSEHMIMDFASFANQLGWTFYDINKGLTYHGISVNHCNDVKYKVTIKNKQMKSYSECNNIDGIELLGSKEIAPIVQTSCQDCTQYLTSLINGQITEQIKSKLNEQIMDNLYWQLTQLLTNQHFRGPISLSESNSD